MTEARSNHRLEALCDGVFAIALTLLILDVKLPSPEYMSRTGEVWRALRNLTPAVFAFVLSFGIILITWVNHHNLMRLVSRSSTAFIYANGFLLLTVVAFPFPTSLLGSFVWTDHAAPAVVLYNAVLAVQAIGWILVAGAALGGRLTSDEAVPTMRSNRRNGYFGLALYAALAIVAVWFPLAVAIITTASWIFWLMLGIRMRQA